MAITITPAADRAQICIDGEFNIYTAADSRQILVDALAEHAAFELNLSEVEEIDTSGVQLLLLLQREAKAHNKALTIAGISPAIQEVITLLNLTELGALAAAGAAV